MSRGVTGGKRDREAQRDQRKREKVDRLQRNREQAALERPEGGDEAATAGIAGPSLAPVDLAGAVIGVDAGAKHEPLAPAKLFVGGLSWDTTAKELEIAFSNFGHVTDASVVLDRSTGRSRGFGFVTFEVRAAADEAVKQMNGRELDGRPLKVNPAELP